ncbi:hypothetical protein WMF11_17640 [Sorangium sp. So ce295]|uniref:hypothetical protein n=1 Tax=Sorangium sp. So ce295 TaxID=3133295 RepID=UPI003F63DF40
MADALDNLAKDIRQDRKKNGKTLKDPAAEDIEIRKELQKQVKEGKMTTTDKRGKLMDLCKFCAQVLRELGLHPANNGGTGKKNGVIGADGKAWNGNVWLAGHPTSFRTAPSSTPPFAGT